jgi:hypothetical protein
VVLLCVAVAREVNVTFALAITAPLLSVRRPVIEPVVWVWAKASPGDKHRPVERKKVMRLEIRLSLRCIESPKSEIGTPRHRSRSDSKGVLRDRGFEFWSKPGVLRARCASHKLSMLKRCSSAEGCHGHPGSHVTDLLRRGSIVDPRLTRNN